MIRSVRFASLSLTLAACSSDPDTTALGTSSTSPSATSEPTTSAPMGSMPAAPTPPATVAPSPTPESQGTSPSSIPSAPLPTAPVPTPTVPAAGGSGGSPTDPEPVVSAEGGSAGEPAPIGGGGAGGSSGGAGATGGAQGGMPVAAGGNPAVGADPSAACGQGNGQPSLDLPNTIVSFPGGYDGSTPVPVVMAFHAAGNPNTQLEGAFGPTLEGEYVMLYPKSAGNGWENNADGSKVDAMFDALDSVACYDRNRVFATGHSSGAQFIVQRLCAGETRFRAVAPIASSVYCNSWEPVPALVIHGLNDSEREAYGLNDGDGAKDIVPYRTSNGCSESLTPVDVEGCSSQGTQVDPGCREFDGCSETTLWCQHNDPQYGTTNHGIPCFASRTIKDFFDSFE